jgi:hypothetical protein
MSYFVLKFDTSYHLLGRALSSGQRDRHQPRSNLNIMYQTITDAKAHAQNGLGSSNLIIDIKVPAKSVEPSVLYSILPSHYAKLSGGLDSRPVEDSRKRLGDTCAYNPFPWDLVQERVTELFGRKKLRHVATLEDALAELDRVKPYYDDATNHH